VCLQLRLDGFLRCGVCRFVTGVVDDGEGTSERLFFATLRVDRLLGEDFPREAPFCRADEFDALGGTEAANVSFFAIRRDHYSYLWECSRSLLRVPALVVNRRAS
jgi:hypothetical protein